MSEPSGIEGDVCAICQEQITQQQIDSGLTYAGPCEHRFHNDSTGCSVQPILDTSNMCPLCRGPLDPDRPVSSTPYDPDNYAPDNNAGDGAQPPVHQDVWVLPSGSVDWDQAVVQNATMQISGGANGGYIDIWDGAGNTAQENVAYDIYLQDGSLAVREACVYGDDGTGRYVFQYTGGNVLI